jgi:hypothetical protein
MNARNEIRDHLIAARMQHWLQIARCPLVNLRCPTWRARKNFWALQKRYPEYEQRSSVGMLVGRTSQYCIRMPHS